jgi:site-specific DNA recombinase
MVEMFDARGVSFVAVTQQFNTTTSMGRLTLNVLLSFAQFEREVTAERIRDKIAASKRKGMWMGGVPPLGYEIRERRLVVNPTEANTVRYIYERYLELGCVRLLSKELDERGIVSKVRISKKGIKSGGCRFSRGALYELLANPVHIGEIRHKQERYPAQHEAIVPRELWERVQQRMRVNAARGRQSSTSAIASPLAGKIFDADGEPLYAQGAAKAGRRTVTTYLEAWLTVPRATTEKAGASLHRNSSERWRLPRGTSSAIAPGCWRCWNGRDSNRLT